ncbi:rab-GTPase-TBC domain-containing protein [Boeremia exigua]|uniref:rab-GTPase-TBC domain-containing protein n=1 Tax=Boeremia exigua TaxID=749465 RepID=UPI001E8E93A3|nr:rab-GTPase-TBC domain-containing protein [Boeremia exigua]KAH6612478.1 rab-GTPase-TBC domain-containing protein [Boeremia exigua]
MPSRNCIGGLEQHQVCGGDDSAPADDTFSQGAALYIISEHDYGRTRSLIPLPVPRNACAPDKAHPTLPHRIGAPVRPLPPRQPRSLMAALAYAHTPAHAMAPYELEPPDLTNSKSSKSSSFHSETLSDYMGPSDLSHFEEINLDDISGGPNVFPMPSTADHRVVYEARSFSSSSLRSTPQHSQHSFRDLTGRKSSYAGPKGPASHAMRPPPQLAPAKMRRGFTSPSAPTLQTMNLAAPRRSSRSPSPSSTHTSAAPTLSRKSSRAALDVLPSPGLAARRHSWQDTKRKTVQEREAECDDEDDELPEDAVIWNIPISPRPAQERSPAPSTNGSPPHPSPLGSTASAGPSSSRTSPAPHSRLPQPPSPHTLGRTPSPPTLERQRTHTWQDTYGSLDPDARVLTEKLEEFQVEFERKQEVKRQQPGLARSSSLSEPETKSKKPALPPIRKSDPLIDPFQPSAEKQKYLSRTRPSWLPPKNPKEEKKHLKEYQRMLARIEEAERLEAQRVKDEALAREKASRIKAEYWSNLLLPNWATEMTQPELRATHRKMWWNGIPPRLRGEVWSKAVGNDLEVTEGTFNIALGKAKQEIKQHGLEALDGRYAQILENTRSVFPELRMFAAPSSPTANDEQPMHQDLVQVCLAYATYRPDISHKENGIHHIAALLLLNLPAPQTFITLSNLLNRPLPLSFLVHDPNNIHAAYSSTLRALSKKSPTLATQLETLRVEPRDYLYHMFSSLFCGRLGVEHAARIMDVYTIESDKIPPRVAVAILLVLEGSCMEGDKAVVERALREKKIDMDVDIFMARVYEAGKMGPA